MIKRFSESSERQLHRLLSEVELGDKKPSQLLRQMRDLGRNQATDNLLKTKWMSLLPSHVTNVLLVAQNVDLNQQADIADKLMENSNGNVMEVETTNSQEVHSIKNPPAKQSDDRLDKLENMILELQKSVRQLRGTNKATFQENRSRSRSRPRFRSADGCVQMPGTMVYKKPKPHTGKLKTLSSTEAESDSDRNRELRLHVYDKATHQRFLIDS
ncbi:GSCOCG00012259001-RA-CDS [Cotesia congregata]|nr:GSCOCG00012259001-RA-CDS [Cotesia congregata]